MPHFSGEPALVLTLLVAPVHPVHVEGDVGRVVHEGAVGHDQAESGRPELHAEVVVLEPADRVPLVESLDGPEGLGAHRQAEPHQPGALAGAAAVGPPARLGEFADGGHIVTTVRDVFDQLVT